MSDKSRFSAILLLVILLLAVGYVQSSRTSPTGLFGKSYPGPDTKPGGTQQVPLEVIPFDEQPSLVPHYNTCNVNQPPVARVNPVPSGDQGTPIVFNGSLSFDPDSDGSVTAYSWIFGDGASSDWQTAHTVTHSYSSPGNFQATLLVRDECGAVSAPLNFTVNVATINPCDNNVPPVADPGDDWFDSQPGEIVPFDGSGSSDANGTIVSYLWQFGDGTSTTSPVVNHIYTEAGIYNATLRVTDNCGAVDTEPRQIEVEIPTGEEEHVQQLSSEGGQIDPDISGNFVAWHDISNGLHAIYVRDLQTGSTTPLSEGPELRARPQISSFDYPGPELGMGWVVVWEEISEGQTDVYVYFSWFADLGKINVTNNSFEQQYPTISNEWIAWQDNRNGNWNIHFLNLVSGSAIVATAGPGDKINPKISDSWLVWSNQNVENAAPMTARQLTSGITLPLGGGTMVGEPALDGNKLVWKRADNNGFNLYLITLSTSTPPGTLGQAITSDSLVESHAQISGNQVVWSGIAGGSDNEDVFRLNLDSDVVTQITINSAGQTKPSVSGERIVWQDFRHGLSDPDIYLYDPNLP